MTPSLAVEAAWRAHWARLLALLARRFRDLDLAEECLADAFAVAADAWDRQGIPGNPAAWLHRAAIRKAIDRKRRCATAEAHARSAAPPPASWEDLSMDPYALPDERLALIFTCCHPALALEARVALTLRLVAGLATPEVARLFLVSEPTMAARLTRAKRKIAAAGVPFREPAPAERDARLGGVLAVVYLLFTEGYSASAGEQLVRRELAREAIRLGALLHALVPGHGEIAALLALMRFQHARRDARVDDAGDLVLLGDQDRSRWHWGEIAEAHALLGDDPASGDYYALQAQIAAAHCLPDDAGSDWPLIAALYARLDLLTGSPIVRLNRAVAMGEAGDSAAALALVATLGTVLAQHRQLPLVRGELLARLGRIDEAVAALGEARLLSVNAVERRHLERRIADLGRG